MGFPTFVLGRGMVDSEVLAVDRAVNEYDERLYFDRNKDSGQWCVYIKTPANEPDLPLYGWDQIPHPEDAIRRTYQNDTLRHGEEILNQIDRANQTRQQPFDDAAEDAAWQAAEVMEWGFRQQGKHPSARIFVPDPKE